KLNVTTNDNFQVNYMWYTVTYDGSETGIFLITYDGQELDLATWEGMDNESVFIINFYANDTAGNGNDAPFISYTIYKDEDGPIITIDPPHQDGDKFSWEAPPYEIVVTESHLNYTWYTLYINGSIESEKVIIGIGPVPGGIFSGTIDQSLWDTCNGTVIICFYANDTLGHLSNFNRTVMRDTFSPIITVIGEPPENDYVAGFIAPNINLTIGNLDEDFNMSWYSVLVNGTWSENIFFNGTSVILDGTLIQIDQSIWGSCANGTVIIKFYANDTFGNLGSYELIMEKDIYIPDIYIDVASGGILHPTIFNQQPIFNITFSYPEPHYSMVWYRIIIPETGTMSDIKILTSFTDIELDSDLWAFLPPECEFIIQVWINDTAGNINNVNSTLLGKDVIAPRFDEDLMRPLQGSYHDEAPNITVIVYDMNLDYDSLHYVVNYPTKYPLENGSLVPFNEYLWDSLDEHVPISIWFEVQDIMGNITYYELIIYKDESAPTIDINLPEENGTIFNNPPTLNISVYNEPNLEGMWYQVYQASKSYLSEIRPLSNCSNVDLFIDIWNILDESEFTIYFIANDTFGAKLNISRTYYKDITPPQLDIHSPLIDRYYNSLPVINTTLHNGTIRWYEVEFYHPGLGIWLRNGTYSINSDYQLFDETLWDYWNLELLGEINFTIFFYASDIASNIFSYNFTIYRDVINPTINIILPEETYYNNTAPPYEVCIFDTNLHYSWYTIGSNPTKHFFTLNGTIATWPDLLEGIIIITFFANDTAGNEFNASRMLKKDISSPDIDINAPVSGVTWGEDPKTLNVDFYDPSGIAQRYYCLVGNTTIWIYDWTGTIDEDAWDSLASGSITIYIFAIDSVGNPGNASVTISKDVEAPIINIEGPINGEPLAHDTPIFNISINQNIASINFTWYVVNDSHSSYIFFITEDTTQIQIDQDIWNLFDSGIITVTIYANDSLGHIGNDGKNIEKDITPPTINIEAPDDFIPCGQDSPEIIIVLNDLNNINHTWIILEGNGTTIFASLNNTMDTSILDFGNGTIIITGSIKTTIWNDFNNGTLIIWFFANDTLGNQNDNSTFLIMRKDIVKPKIIFLRPEPNDQVGRDAPLIEISIVDPNLEDTLICYYSINGDPSLMSFSWSESAPYVGINQTFWEYIWDSLNPGDLITITIFANDTLGNEGQESLTLRKYKEEPFDLGKTLMGPMGLIITGSIALVLTPLSIGLVKTSFYKRLEKKDKNKLRSILIFSFLLIGLIFAYISFNML
ncbi:MAG: hypothetical protein ACFE8P_11355, partial [Promethearchaeota archaeon]